LLAIKPTWERPRFEYGRADKGTDPMLLAKLYFKYMRRVIGQKNIHSCRNPNKRSDRFRLRLSPKYINTSSQQQHESEIIFSQILMERIPRRSTWFQVNDLAEMQHGGWSGYARTACFV